MKTTRFFLIKLPLDNKKNLGNQYSEPQHGILWVEFIITSQKCAANAYIHRPSLNKQSLSTVTYKTHCDWNIPN